VDCRRGSGRPVERATGQDHPLFTLDNILITPHIAWNTKESKERSKAQLKEIIISIIHGRFPINLVNPEVKGRWKSGMGEVSVIAE